MQSLTDFIRRHGHVDVPPYRDALVNRGSVHVRKVEGASSRLAIFPTRRKAQAFVDLCSQAQGIVAYSIKVKKGQYIVRFR